jgi:hypothetical protein
MHFDVQEFFAILIGAGLVGLLGPLLAITWWNATSRRSASPSLVKGIWLGFGGLGLLTLVLGLIAIVFDIHLS